MAQVTADEFLSQVEALGPRVGMGQIFALAKAHMDMPLAEIETLLEQDDHRAARSS